jgi:hypothetical protein
MVKTKIKDKVYAYDYRHNVSINFPPELKKKLFDYAAEKRWSLAKTCAYIIENAFQKDVLP